MDELLMSELEIIRQQHIDIFAKGIWKMLQKREKLMKFAVTASISEKVRQNIEKIVEYYDTKIAGVKEVAAGICINEEVRTRVKSFRAVK
mgnify:CR=1 FL=1